MIYDIIYPDYMQLYTQKTHRDLILGGFECCVADYLFISRILLQESEE